MFKRSALVAVSFSSLLAISACDKTPKGEQVATINGDAITTTEYQNILQAQFGT